MMIDQTEVFDFFMHLHEITYLFCEILTASQSCWQQISRKLIYFQFKKRRAYKAFVCMI